MLRSGCHVLLTLPVAIASVSVITREGTTNHLKLKTQRANSSHTPLFILLTNRKPIHPAAEAKNIK